MRVLKDFESIEEKEEFRKMVQQAFDEAKAKGETNLFITCVKKVR